MSRLKSTPLIPISFNGHGLLVDPDKTILAVAEEQGVEIPTLCHDPRLEPYGSCWVCLVTVEGARGFVPACATKVVQGMKIVTDSAEIHSARRMALELLLSNHYGDCKAPCTLACPAGIDVQGYIGLIANRRYGEALSLIKEQNPFPAVIGRVCPRPCEEVCRRNLVDQAVGIDWLKRFVADLDLFSQDSYDPPLSPSNGRRVAVVGAGPAGLSAAYYLVQAGISVTVFEAEEKPGGMLRYGIPDYRLPQEVLDLEVETILRLGVELKTGVRLGEHIQLEELKRDYQAVILAFGAWKSRALRVQGEDCPGVLSGIEFLRQIALGKSVRLGRRVAVVGGGNTAVDAARTSLRLGAEEVFLFYRRTRKEMPAAEMEIEEAMEEGVKISYLVAPVEILRNGDCLECMRLIKMELGEPDASGRRRPIPLEGSEFDQAVDNVICAIGQYADTRRLSEIEGLVDERQNLVCDPETGETALPGLFAAGDLVTGPDIAIRAIAGGKRAAESALAYLAGRPAVRSPEFLSRKEDFGPVGEEEYHDTARVPRERMKMLPPRERTASFAEIELGYSEEQAGAEANRCLECGCQDLYDCRLKHYAEQYDARAVRFPGEIQKHPIDESHPYIQRDPAKCILCGRCIRICLELQGIGVFGYVNRGFSSLVAPSFNISLGEDSLCISCGQCVSACPVGALTEKLPRGKTVPLKERVEQGFCSLCSVGCPVEYRYHGSLLMRITERRSPDHAGPVTRFTERSNSTWGGNLCRKGRFGHSFLTPNGFHSPRGADGNALSLQEAKQRLAGLLSTAKRPLLRLSPLLAGEGIARFLRLARQRGIRVEPLGLESLEPGWAELCSPDREAGFLFEDAGSLTRERVLILVGNLEDSNNVAFTEVLKLKSQGVIWAVGRDPSIYDRFWDRVSHELSGLAELLDQAGQQKRRVDVLLNPEELLKKEGQAGEREVLKLLHEAATRPHYRLTLFWNARNSGYLLRSIPGELREAPGNPDLLLQAGPHPYDPSATDQAPIGTQGIPQGVPRVSWDRQPAANALSIPLPADFLLSGYLEPSGRPPLSVGALDRSALAALLLE